jgi:hypothetical protein
MRRSCQGGSNNAGFIVHLCRYHFGVEVEQG